ncbi:periplasmic chaperone for outer membrane proteins Skp [Salinimicrobium sediminis]|uniref:Periplasmic chaperone for outer membrane proteins Skp n=1 Tax=Salinimicrobium sediminis TaxID=1343891 RepID=A0A285X286_9FLAO|nr:OmpH family outer membrane protein [Salinimicrobium sediminis]SOC79422.1 periplasmic chaperone for outer membrane proteins Skp [Salinimicrobium sediminis]
MKKLLMVLSFGALLASCNNDKTAYVDTTVLIQEYSEMKEVEADFTERSESLKKELDSAAQGFQQEVMAFRENAATMSEAERQAKQEELMQKQQILQQQQQMRSGQLRQEGDAVIDSLITKVKDFVKVYGEENDYTYIFGSNESANIMYAEEGLDITQDILKELNEGKLSTSEVEAEE